MWPTTTTTLANNREQLKSATIANFYLRNLQQGEGDVYVNCYRCLLLTLSSLPLSLILRIAAQTQNAQSIDGGDSLQQLEKQALQ